MAVRPHGVDGYPRRWPEYASRRARLDRRSRELLSGARAWRPPYAVCYQRHQPYYPSSTASRAVVTSSRPRSTHSTRPSSATRSRASTGRALVAWNAIRFL